MLTRGGHQARLADVSFSRRVREWFWRDQALAESRNGLPRPGDPAFDHATRAAQFEALARVAKTNRELGGQAVACELFRLSISWALRALNRGEEPPEQSTAASASTSVRITPESLVESGAWPAHLAHASFDEFAALPEAELSVACSQMQGLAATLLRRLADERRGYERVVRQRTLRAGAVVLLSCLALGAILFRKPRPADLAEGADWHLSSAYTGFGGCGTPRQTCAGAKKDGWFFHTGEGDRDPWIEFDLDGNKLISRVEIENRAGCCAERAIPLSVEVSIDRSSWQQVAVREERFDKWTATFPPVLTAWVRLRVRNGGPLHLKRVRIFE